MVDGKKIPQRPIDAFSSRAVTPAEMKAFSHPLRMQLYRLLNDLGEATATQLSELTGESTGQTSYHLRQLEKFGFVTEADRPRSGRERWWKAEGFTISDRDFDDHPAGQEAVLLARHFTHEHFEAVVQWFDQQPDQPREWRDATVSSGSTAWMTAEELSDLSVALMALVEQHTDAAKQRRDDGDDQPRRRVRIYLDTLMLPHASPE